MFIPLMEALKVARTGTGPPPHPARPGPRGQGVLQPRQPLLPAQTPYQGDDRPAGGPAGEPPPTRLGRRASAGLRPRAVPPTQHGRALRRQTETAPRRRDRIRQTRLHLPRHPGHRSPRHLAPRPRQRAVRHGLVPGPKPPGLRALGLEPWALGLTSWKPRGTTDPRRPTPRSGSARPPLRSVTGVERPPTPAASGEPGREAPPGMPTRPGVASPGTGPARTGLCPPAPASHVPVPSRRGPATACPPPRRISRYRPGADQPPPARRKPPALAQPGTGPGRGVPEWRDLPRRRIASWHRHTRSPAGAPASARSGGMR